MDKERAFGQNERQRRRTLASNKTILSSQVWPIIYIVWRRDVCLLRTNKQIYSNSLCRRWSCGLIYFCAPIVFYLLRQIHTCGSMCVCVYVVVLLLFHQYLCNVFSVKCHVKNLQYMIKTFPHNSTAVSILMMVFCWRPLTHHINCWTNRSERTG